MKKAAPLAGTIQALREALAPSIQEAKSREAFIAGSTSQARHGQSGPVSRSSSVPSKPSVPSRPGNSQFGALGPSSQSVPTPSQSSGTTRLMQPSRLLTQPMRPTQPLPPTQASRPMGGASQPVSRPSGASQLTGPGNSARQLDLEPAEAAAFEQALSRFIGPMAKMLIRKETARCTSFKEFVTAVAANVDRADQREEFLLALRRALPKRQF